MYGSGQAISNDAGGDNLYDMNHKCLATPGKWMRRLCTVALAHYEQTVRDECDGCPAPDAVERAGGREAGRQGCTGTL